MDRHETRLSRRHFVLGASGLGLVAGCGRLPWQEQPPAKLPRMGYLGTAALDTAPTVIAALRQGLGEHGYHEGENLRIEWRPADGHPERLPELAADLVSIPVDVILASGPRAVEAAISATSTFPIVMANVGDPVAAGYIVSLGRPGGNVTGLADQPQGLRPKRLQLLHEAFPGISRVALLWIPTRQQAAMKEMEEAAATLGVKLHPLAVQEPDDFEGAIEAAVKDGADALMFVDDTLFFVNRARLRDFAAARRLPAMYPDRRYVEKGGLIAYGPSVYEQLRRTAYYVDRILKGAKPADLPVEQPMTFEFVVNLKTAQALGLTFPNEIMLQVTEVVQ